MGLRGYGVWTAAPAPNNKLLRPQRYDVWHSQEAEVDIQMVLQTMKKNVENVKGLIKLTISKIKDNPECRCRQDIKNALIS